MNSRKWFFYSDKQYNVCVFLKPYLQTQPSSWDRVWLTEYTETQLNLPLSRACVIFFYLTFPIVNNHLVAITHTTCTKLSMSPRDNQSFWKWKWVFPLGLQSGGGGIICGIGPY